MASELRRRGLLFRLSVVGDGPDGAELKQRCARLRSCKSIEFLGAVSHVEVANLLADTDILLLPSRYEGCPNAVLEAMAEGVVPVATKLRGVTDWIIDDGRTGMLCRYGDPKSFARAIVAMDRDRKGLVTMQTAAIEAVRRRFSAETMATAYHELFSRLIMSQPVREPRPWSEFRQNPAYRPTWRRFLPRWLKQYVRRRFRVG